MRFLTNALVAVLLLFMLVSCAEKRDGPPLTNALPADSLISPEKMIHILADMQVLEAGLNFERNDGAQVKEKSVFYYNGLFKKYKISRSRYDANLKYYSQNPMEMAKMYDKVIREIEIRQKSFPSKK